MLDTGGEWVIVNSEIGRRVGTFEVEIGKVRFSHSHRLDLKRKRQPPLTRGLLLMTSALLTADIWKVLLLLLVELRGRGTAKTV